jgi:ABC-type glycerol-3-phosphate transport system substrate-binding protein
VRKIYLLWLAGAGLCLVLFAVLRPTEAGSPEERAALDAGRVVITYWDRHTGHEHEARAALIREYNESQGKVDKVYVRALPIGYNVLMEKILTVTAVGSPPDICSIDTSILAQLSAQGCFTGLSSWMATVPSLAENEFFPHTWALVNFRGYDGATQHWVTDVWGIPTTTDTYCLLWNKEAFRRAGLDPNRPPRTIAELEQYAGKLTIRGPNGIEQIGFVPWFPWDLTHMWGGFFGGKWYDTETGYATCGDDPKIIAAYAWQQRFSIDPAAAQQLPFVINPNQYPAYEKMAAYMSANNPFYAGKVAMITEGEWQVTFIPKFASHLDWGVAPIPQPEGVPPMAYGPSCVADAVPISARHKDAAFKFLQWFYSPRADGRPSPVSDYNEAIHNIPPIRAEALQERFMGDPKFRVFVEQLLDKPVLTSPIVPQSQYFMDKIDNARQKVVLRKMTPEEAARSVEKDTNEVLADTYRLMGASANDAR